MRLKLQLTAFLLCSLLCSPALHAMPYQELHRASNDASPAFEVATIKPSRPEAGLAIQIQGNRFVSMGSSLVDLMKYAYGIHADQIAGGPEWIQTEKFDLLAAPLTEIKLSADQMKIMVQTMLADRFALKLHKESRSLPVYAIVATKGGPKLTTSTRDPQSIPSSSNSPGRFNATNVAMTDLATFLQRKVMDKPVIDRTDLKGRYDLSIKWAPDDAPDKTDTLPGFFTAIQEQLGLRLEATKAQIDVLVIDHVELPSAN